MEYLYRIYIYAFGTTRVNLKKQFTWRIYCFVPLTVYRYTDYNLNDRSLVVFKIDLAYIILISSSWHDVAMNVCTREIEYEFRSDQPGLHDTQQTRNVINT